MTSTPTALIQQLYACFAQQDLPGILALMAPDVVWTLQCPNPPVVPGGPRHGVAGVQEFFVQVATCEDISEFVIDYLVGDDSHVIARGHETTLVRATGKTYKSAWTHCWTVANGQITQWEGFYDSAAMAAAYTP
ncbi:MAG: nuclear transport factor 2 family protein [bacterium]